MSKTKSVTLKRVRLLAWMLLALLALGLVVGCQATGGDEPTAVDNMEMDGSDEGDHDAMDMDEANEDGHEHDEDRVERAPNNGATITIVQPTDDAVIKVDDELIVEVAVEGIELGTDGNHWHVYIDGASWGMITGGDTDTALRGMEPGMHKVEVYLAGGDHIDLEDGDSFMLTVEE